MSSTNNLSILSTSKLDKDLRSSPALSDFYESFMLVKHKVSSLFITGNQNLLLKKIFLTNTSTDLIKSRIIRASQSNDYLQVIKILQQLSTTEAEQVGKEFLALTAKKISKHQSISVYSEFLLCMFKLFGFDLLFLKRFLKYDRDASQIQALLDYMRKWNQTNLQKPINEIILESLSYSLENLSVHSKYEQFFVLFKMNQEIFTQIDSEDEKGSLFRKLFINQIQFILFKNSNRKIFSETFKFFKEQQNFILTTIILNKVFELITKYLADEEYLIITDQFMRENKIQLNVVTFNSMINYYCLRGEFPKAVQVYEDINDQGLKPDAYTFSTLIKGIKNMHHPNLELALKFMKIYEQEFEAKDIIIYNSLLDVFISCERFDEVDRIF